MSQYGCYEPNFTLKGCATCARKFCILRWFGCFNKLWKGGEE